MTESAEECKGFLALTVHFSVVMVEGIRVRVRKEKMLEINKYPPSFF